jgi:hypothetical protein
MDKKQKNSNIKKVPSRLPKKSSKDKPLSDKFVADPQWFRFDDPKLQKELDKAIEEDKKQNS